MKTQKIANPIIKLTPDEARFAAKEGKRAITDYAYENDYTVGIDSIRAHQIGGAAELAVNKFFGLPWRGFQIELRHDPDAYFGEVRCTQRANGRLLLNARDQAKADRAFIHVISRMNQEFEIMGWLYGHEIMLPENEFNRPQFVEKIWKVENHQLRHIGELK